MYLYSNSSSSFSKEFDFLNYVTHISLCHDDEHLPNEFNMTTNVSIYAESCSQDLAKNLIADSNYLSSSFVKSVAKFHHVIPRYPTGFKDWETIVLVRGSNDVNCNKAGVLLNELVLLQLSNNINVATLLIRHDLPVWECVIDEIRKTNKKIVNLCKNLKNVKFLKICDYDRLLFT